MRDIRLKLILGGMIGLFTSCTLEHDSSKNAAGPYPADRSLKSYHYYGPSVIKPDEDITIPATGRNNVTAKQGKNGEAKDDA